MKFKIILQTIKSLIPIVIVLMMAVEKQNSEGLYFGDCVKLEVANLLFLQRALKAVLKS